MPVSKRSRYENRFPFTNHETKDRFIALRNLFELCETHDMLIIGSHPFREDHPLYKVNSELISRFSALDLNGKDLYVYGKDKMYEKVMRLGEECKVPVVTGSDTHQYLQIGCVMTIFERECDTIQEIKNEIKLGRYKLFISPNLRIKVKAATMIKNLLKKQLEVH